MKKLYIAAASALALGLALSSLPAQAQKPGTPTGLAAAVKTIPTEFPTVWVVEEVASRSKKSIDTSGGISSKTNTYRLDPSGQTFSTPVRLCMKYNSGTTSANRASNALSSALTSVLKEVKDPSGKATYKPVTHIPEDDKPNSQMCLVLKTPGQASAAAAAKPAVGSCPDNAPSTTNMDSCKCDSVRQWRAVNQYALQQWECR